MSRGKAPQPYRECDYCGKSLASVRHPQARFCDPVCRQRDRYARDHVVDGKKCLVCHKIFMRVGSHVVQVHGYSSTHEYLSEYGLMRKETRTDEYAEKMSRKITPKALANLDTGAPTRYTKSDDHAERLRIFWDNRRAKQGYKLLGTSLDNRRKG